MARWKRIAVLALVVAGLLASTAGADLVGSQRLGLALALGGSVLAWGSTLLMTQVSWGRWWEDERVNQIYRRGMMVSWFAVTALLFTSMRALEYTTWQPSAGFLAMVVQVVNLVAFVVGVGWYERRM